MGKVYTKHILRLLWKMVENVFFLGSEHVGRGGMVAPQKLPFLLNGPKQVQVLGYSPRCHHSPPATRPVHYRNSDLILSHQCNFTWVIIHTILVCIMHNHPISTSYCRSVLSYFWIGEDQHHQ